MDRYKLAFAELALDESEVGSGKSEVKIGLRR